MAGFVEVVLLALASFHLSISEQTIPYLPVIPSPSSTAASIGEICPAETYTTTDFGYFQFPEILATVEGNAYTAPCPFGFKDDGIAPFSPDYPFELYEESRIRKEAESGAKRICKLKQTTEGNILGLWDPSESNVTVIDCRSAESFMIVGHVETFVITPSVLTPLHFRQALPMLSKLLTYAVDDVTCAQVLIDSIGKMLGSQSIYEDEMAWQDAAQLFDMVELYASKSYLKPGYKVTVTNDEIAVETVQFFSGRYRANDNPLDYVTEIGRIDIKLPAEAMSMSLNQTGTQPRLKITAYSENLFFHWKARESSKKSGATIHGDRPYARENLTKELDVHPFGLNWRVLNIEFNQASIKDLSEKFEYSFKTNKSTEGFLWRCVYWDDEEQLWSTDGMETVQKDDYVTCKSSHMTAFSVIIDPLPLPFPGSDYAPINNSVHSHILSILSSLGSALSIFGLTGTILTYGLFRCLRRERSNRILLSLSISLLFLHLISISSEKHLWHSKCFIPSAMIHYFLHTSMWWMLIEAHHMHQLLISVFVKPESRFLLKRSVIAWGIPLVIVGICGGIHPEVYTTGRNELCVIAAHLNLPLYYGAYLTPAVGILVINLCIFCRIFKVLYKQTNRQRKQLPQKGSGTASKKQGKPQQGSIPMESLKAKTKYTMLSPTQIKGAITVMILFGVGWIFGLLAIGPFEVFFKYVFVICNAGQGLLVFIFRVILHPQACREWKKAILGFNFDTSELSITSSTSVSSKTQQKASFSYSPNFISASSSVENSLTPSNPMAQDLAKTLACILRASDNGRAPNPTNPPF